MKSKYEILKGIVNNRCDALLEKINNGGSEYYYAWGCIANIKAEITDHYDAIASLAGNDEAYECLCKYIQCKYDWCADACDVFKNHSDEMLIGLINVYALIEYIEYNRKE